MIKVILRLDCGVGMNEADAYLVSEEDWANYNNVDKGILEDRLATFAWEQALEFAAGYGIYPEEDQPEDYDEDEVDSWHSDTYSNDIDGWFELYNPEKHDGLMIGTQTEWDWKEL